MALGVVSTYSFWKTNVTQKSVWKEGVAMLRFNQKVWVKLKMFCINFDKIMKNLPRYCVRRLVNIFHLMWIVSADIYGQSICTNYSCFENIGQFVILKKIRSKIWTWKKQGAKKQDHCYSKREKARLPLLFLNNNNPVFLHPAFRKKQGPWFFKSSRP